MVGAAAKLAGRAVGSAKIADGAVGASKLAPDVAGEVVSSPGAVAAQGGQTNALFSSGPEGNSISTVMESRAVRAPRSQRRDAHGHRRRGTFPSAGQDCTFLGHGVA